MCLVRLHWILICRNIPGLTWNFLQRKLVRQWVGFNLSHNPNPKPLSLKQNHRLFRLCGPRSQASPLGLAHSCFGFCLQEPCPWLHRAVETTSSSGPGSAPFCLPFVTPWSPWYPVWGLVVSEEKVAHEASILSLFKLKKQNVHSHACECGCWDLSGCRLNGFR